MLLKIIFICTLAAGAWSKELVDLPPWFKLGAGSSAYQIEGAWNVDDKTPSSLDLYFNNAGGENAKDAAKSYYEWKADVEVAKQLGLHHYRFSISWTRLLPTGFSNRINDAGYCYYSDLIDELLRSGIEPVVTIQHFDIPQSIKNMGGWLNPKITNWYADYARVVFSLFGDRVKTWLTINEPQIYSYLINPMIEGQNNPLLISKHMFIAHAKAWRIYDQVFKPKYKGRVSIVNQHVWYEGETAADNELAEMFRQYANGAYGHPIYSKEGDWPPFVKALFRTPSPASYNTTEGPPLPYFTRQEVELVRGTYDFYAFNYYTAVAVRKAKPGEEISIYPFGGSTRLNAVCSPRPEWEQTGAPTFVKYAPGLRKQMKWLKKQYGDVSFFITENGYPANTTDLNDEPRTDWIREHLEQINLAIKEGIRVEGYTVWSMIDTFEFNNGYSINFGLVAVDFSDPRRKRTPRGSALYYALQTRNTRKKPRLNISVTVKPNDNTP